MRNLVIQRESRFPSTSLGDRVSRGCTPYKHLKTISEVGWVASNKLQNPFNRDVLEYIYIYIYMYVCILFYIYIYVYYITWLHVYLYIYTYNYIYLWLLVYSLSWSFHSENAGWFNDPNWPWGYSCGGGPVEFSTSQARKGSHARCPECVAANRKQRFAPFQMLDARRIQKFHGIAAVHVTCSCVFFIPVVYYTMHMDTFHNAY